MADGEKPIALPSSTLSNDIEAGELTTTAQRIPLDPHGFNLFPQPVEGDALDPLNWTWLQKHAILSIVMALYFLFTYLTTTTVPSFPSLQTRYNLSAEQVNWTVAIPALGLALGPLICSSPADIIGRRPVFIFGTLIATAATIGAALAPTYSGYMAARFFQGLGVSPAATVGLAIINDLFFEHERGQKIGLWVLAIDLGLLVGPLIGGFVDLAGTALIQWVTAIMFGVVLFAEVFFLPETLYPRKLMLERRERASAVENRSEKTLSFDVASELKRTKRLGLVSLQPVPGIKHPRVTDTLVRFVKTFRYTVVPVAVLTYCFGWLWWIMSVITLVPVAYASYSPQTQGLFFIGLILGTLVSEIFFSGALSDYLVIKLSTRPGATKTAEMRIWLIYPAAILTAIGLIVWGISIDRNYHWIVGQVAFAFVGAGIQMSNAAVCAYVIDAYPLQSMSVVVFYVVIMNLAAFIDPFFIVPWVDDVGFTLTFAGHAVITVFFCVPVFALLHTFGERMRAESGVPDWVNPEYDLDEEKS